MRAAAGAYAGGRRVRSPIIARRGDPRRTPRPPLSVTRRSLGRAFDADHVVRAESRSRFAVEGLTTLFAPFALDAVADSAQDWVRARAFFRHADDVKAEGRADRVRPRVFRLLHHGVGEGGAEDARQLGLRVEPELATA